MTEPIEPDVLKQLNNDESGAFLIPKDFVVPENVSLKRERRIKIVPVDPDSILRLFNREFQSTVMMPYGIPTDARVEAVCYEFMTDSFLLRVSHPSFPLVESGFAIPNHEGFCVVEGVK